MSPEELPVRKPQRNWPLETTILFRDCSSKGFLQREKGRKGWGEEAEGEERKREKEEREEERRKVWGEEGG